MIKNYKQIIIAFVAALFLMVVAFYNGYPIYGGDTHAYVNTAFTRDIQSDRTPFYGMFIRFSSFWESLWFTIFAQSLILACLLTRYIELLYTKKAGVRFILLCVICITSFTCVSWVSSCLMSDIFTPVLLLGILLYLFDGKASTLQKILYIGIIFIAISEHNSHFLIVTIFAGLLFLFALIKRKITWIKKSVVLFVTSVLFWLSMCSLNYSYNNGFVFSGGAHMFIVAKFAESGILDEYLNDSCGKKNLKLCECKGDIPAYPWDFMWPRAGSKLNNLGGWEKSKPEFQMIIHDVFTTPKYIKMFIVKSIITTFKQMCYIVEVDKPVFLSPDQWDRTTVIKYFGDEEKEFDRSRQNNNIIDPSCCNIFYYLFFVLSSIWILLFYTGSANKRILKIYVCLVVFLVINAFVTSVFSTVCDRFQERVFWILPATNGILILKYYQKKYFDSVQLIISEAD